MYHRPAANLAEELLLLCADHDSGRLRRPLNLHRALGGAVLTELLLAGALTVDGKRITEVQPLTVGDPFADQVLARLTAAGTGKRPGLDRWVRKASKHAVQPYLEALLGRGLLLVRRRRILGLIPAPVFSAAQPGWAAEAAARILLALPPEGGRYSFDETDLRDRHLLALAGAVGLDRRLFRGPDARTVRRRVQALIRSTPIADAVRRVVRSDEAAAASGAAAASSAASIG